MSLELDNLICMLRYYLRADTALLSIIDDANDRQIFRSHSGLLPQYETKPETPLSHSFCLKVRDTDAPLIVTDARYDPRFRDNPAIEALHVVSYLGAPIYADGGPPVGAACAISSKSRSWNWDEVEFVQSVAKVLTGLLRYPDTSYQTETAARSSSRFRSAFSPDIFTAPLCST
ncbi:MAG: GAF domain-containing protein [Pseudomonadota bacterium]